MPASGGRTDLRDFYKAGVIPGVAGLRNAAQGKSGRYFSLMATFPPAQRSRELGVVFAIAIIIGAVVGTGLTVLLRPRAESFEACVQRIMKQQSEFNALKARSALSATAFTEVEEEFMGKSRGLIAAASAPRSCSR
jgi:hypothetical protein